MEQLGGILIATACGLGIALALAVWWLLSPSARGKTPARAVKRPAALREGSLQIRRVLSDAESAFYWTLKRAIGDRWVILPRVPLHRVFRRVEHLPREMYTMLENGEVDFLLVHPRSWEPVCGIELDDSTHYSPTRPGARSPQGGAVSGRRHPPAPLEHERTLGRGGGRHASERHLEGGSKSPGMRRAPSWSASGSSAWE